MAPKIHWEVDAQWYSAWRDQEAARWQAHSVPDGPLVSILMPCHNTDAALLREAVESVRAQSYQNWQLCLADDGSSDGDTLAVLAEYQDSDPRIRQCRLPQNQGIAAASNAALALADGEFAIPMDHDDRLPEYALAVLVEYLNAGSNARFAYSDADRIDAEGRHSRPFFKADWNYDLFLAQNYLNHLTAIDTSTLRSVGGWREGYEGSQDYDLYLRLTEVLAADEILHVPHILYHWREIEGSFSQSRLGTAVQAARRAIADHLARRDGSGEVSAPPGALIYNHIRWELPAQKPHLALVLLGADSPEPPPLPDDELVIDVMTTGPGAVSAASLERVLADAADAEVIMLLSAAVTELPAKTVRELIARCLCQDAGCVGPKCVEAGVEVFGIPEQLTPNPAASGLYSQRWKATGGINRGYFTHLLLHQNTDVLRPDAVVFRREHLQAYGKLDQHFSSLHLALADFCLHTAERGFRNVWNGAVTVEFAGGGLPDDCDAGELARFCEHWRKRLLSARFADWDIHWTTETRG